MIIALLIVIVVILLFGAAAVRGLLSNGLAIAVALLLVLLVIGSVRNRYDTNSAKTQHSLEILDEQNLTLEAVSRDLGKPQSSLLDVVAYTADDEFEMCGTIAGTSGYGGRMGRQRWISNGGGRFEYEKHGSKQNFDDRVALLCTFDHTAATMRG